MHRRRFLQSAAAAAVCGPLLARAEEPRAAKEVPWLAEVQTAPEQLPEGTPQLAPLLVDAEGGAITTRAAWEKRRGELREAWLEFLGPLEIERAKPPAYEVLDQDKVEGVIRRLIRYEVEPGEPVEAWLLGPDREGGGRPGVVVFHSTVDHSLHQPAGVKGVPEKAFGLMLAKRGSVCLCPRNYLWPENERIDARGEAARFAERRPKTKGMMRMLADGLRAWGIRSARRRRFTRQPSMSGSRPR